MQHIHFNEIDSTQKYLMSIKKENVLISTSKQTGGVGRTGNTWQHLTNSLAFSFIINPSENFSLTTIEIGLILAKYFKLKIKWPNDLYNDQGKCIGIICNILENRAYIGIGINYGKIDTTHIDYPISTIYPNLVFSSNDYKTKAKDIYIHILKNRIPPKKVLADINDYLLFLNKTITIDDVTGVFSGIDDQGHALINQDGNIVKLIAGILQPCGDYVV